MTLFVLIATDKPESLATRLAVRPDHLAYMATYGDQVKLAGPLLNGPEETPSGSMIILDLPDKAAAEKFAKNDPYAQANLFSHVTISPYKAAIGTL